MRKDAGITVLELLVTLAIVGILASVPSGLSTLVRHVLASATVTNCTPRSITRYMSINHNSHVVICKSSDGMHCNHGLSNWKSGWLIFANLDHDGSATLDADEPILRVHGKSLAHVSIISNFNSFTLKPMELRSVNGKFL